MNIKNSSALNISDELKKNWNIVQLKLKEIYGVDVYKSWIENVEAKGVEQSSLILKQDLLEIGLFLIMLIKF